MIIDFSHQTKNFNQRPINKKIDYIVIHNTERNFHTSLNLLTQLSDYPVSCHYLIDEDGTPYQLLDDSLRAWHAGQSYWRGQENLNDNSIGIELVNSQPDPFNGHQINTCTALCHTLMQAHNIPPCNVLAHSDIAPYRKTDPGAQFPWAILAQHGIVPPLPNSVAPNRNFDSIDPIQAFANIGYDTHPLAEHPELLPLLIANFQRRYCQDNVTGVLDVQTIGCLIYVSNQC